MEKRRKFIAIKITLSKKDKSQTTNIASERTRNIRSNQAPS